MNIILINNCFSLLRTNERYYVLFDYHLLFFKTLKPMLARVQIINVSLILDLIPLSCSAGLSEIKISTL